MAVATVEYYRLIGCRDVPVAGCVSVAAVNLSAIGNGLSGVGKNRT